MLDASAVLELLLGGSPQGAEVARRIMASAPDLAAPELLDLEIVQTLRRYARRGSIEASLAAQLLADYQDLPIALYPHRPFLARCFELRDRLTAYDAVYLALGEALGATLLTLDSAFASVPGSTADVELVR